MKKRLLKIKRVLGEGDFNQLVLSVEPTQHLGRLRFWQEKLFAKVAEETGIKVTTLDQFLNLFGNLKPEPQPVTFEADIDESHPSNAAALKYLRGPSKIAKMLFTEVSCRTTVYWESGCHPELVGWVWDTLGSADSRLSPAYIYGRPCLVNEASKLVVAICMGTAYVFRAADNAMEELLTSSYEQTRDWGNGEITKLPDILDEHWFFGKCHDEEAAWITDG